MGNRVPKLQEMFMALVLIWAAAACSAQTPRGATNSGTNDSGKGACSRTLIDIAAGNDHTCAVTKEGQVGCWGSNERRQAAPASDDEVVGFSPIEGLPAARQVAAGRAYSCSLTREGQVYCWGRKKPLAKITPLAAVQSIAIGDTYACAQTRAGRISCWDADTQEPGAISGTEGSSSLTVGEAGACVLDSKGRPTCWNVGEAKGTLEPVALTKLKQIATSKFSREIPATDGVSSRYDWTCAIDSKRQTHCWGDNLENLRADLGLETTKGPLAIPGLDQVESISVSESSVCGQRRDGRVACWGSMTGNGDPGPQSTQYALGLQDIVKLSLGGGHACALDKRGRAHCWGEGGEYQLGRRGDRPRAVPGLGATSRIEVGDKFACSAATTGAIHCWGHLPWKQGQATALPQESPFEKGSRLSIGMTDVCGVSPKGELRCTSASPFIGNGTIALPQPATEVSVGELHACAVMQGGAISCWGQGFAGQLGNGHFDDAMPMQPVAVALPAPATHVSVGRTHSCAWNEAAPPQHQVWCWGENNEGQLGVGNKKNQAVPITVPLPPVRAVEAGYYATCALLSDNTARCWGRNGEGQLGIGKVPNAESPVPVPGLADIAEISLGDNKTCAIDKKGSLFCWGRVEPYTPEPEQVALGKAAGKVSTSGDQTCVTWQEGGVSCWHRSASDSSQTGYGSRAWFPILSCAESLR